MNRMCQFAVAFALLAAASDSDAAFSDLATLPPADQPYYAYLTTSTVAPEHREKLADAISFVAASLSHKSYLADQIPRRVLKTNLLRLDLRGLAWDKTWAKVVAEHYVPNYRPDLHKTGQVPLVVSGLWFVAAVTDSNVTADAQYELLYGQKPPKTLAEFEKFHTVNGSPDLAFARLEGQSGVNVAGERVIQNLPVANRGYYWRTLDSRIVAGETDQLENIAKKDLKHDASEAIAALPKYLGGSGGTLQAYFLANAKGERQEKAPADIVRDDTGTRGVEIRNTLGCIACHSDGIRHPTLDRYRSYIQSGARIYTKDKATQEEIDRYFQSPVAKEIERNNQDYASALQLINGLTPQQNAVAFRDLVRLYDSPVNLEQAARELYVSKDEWRLALGNYSRTYELTGRLALMAQGEPISRDQWAANFALAQKVIYAWNASH